jgi:hypothetical protein
VTQTPRCDFYSDTDPKALEVFLELQRKMPPEKKLEMVFGMIDFLHRLVEAKLRKERPQADDHEIKMRLASRLLDRETMIRAFGWDPGAHD